MSLKYRDRHAIVALYGIKTEKGGIKEKKRQI
jgi:hypothetical protein